MIRTDGSRSLLSLLSRGEPIVIGGATTVLGAKEVRRGGFDAVYVGGHALGALHYGVPDYGVLAQDEIIDHTRRIAEAVEIPTIVDADELGNSVTAIRRSIRRYEQAGIAAVHVEDDDEPKHSTYRVPLLATSEMQSRIATAVESTTDSTFVVIARCNEFINRKIYGSGCLEDAIARGQAYAEAGAQALWIPLSQPEERPIIAEAMSIPVMDVDIIIGGIGELDTAYERWVTKLARDGVLPPEAFERSGDLESILDDMGYSTVAGPTYQGLALGEEASD